MSKFDTEGVSFSVRHVEDYTSVKKYETEAKEAYVDDNSDCIILEAEDGDSAATIILDHSAAERLNEKLTGALE